MNTHAELQARQNMPAHLRGLSQLPPGYKIVPEDEGPTAHLFMLGLGAVMGVGWTLAFIWLQAEFNSVPDPCVERPGLEVCQGVTHG